MIRLFIFLLFLSQNSFAQQSDTNRVWGDWQAWGSQKNGTYTNPILPADYSDIDCIRVGDDYYTISSTFQYSPGMVILHSKNLVDWQIISHAVDDITQVSTEMNWDKMNRYGKGIWAGAIRYNNNKYWIYFGTPDEGYFMTSADKPTGPWQPLHCVLNEKGWDDCCPFWDDDGQGYLVGTNFSDGYKIHLFKLSADGKTLIKESDKIIHQSKGSEANKLYKINGWYYHLFSEVKAEGRVIMMERSKNIYGPFDEAKQLNHAEKKYKEPNQGGLVQTKKGDWYFLTHHGTGDWSGRNMSLLPVTWIDGWPIIGKVGTDGIGTMQWSGKMPLPNTPKMVPQTSDDFNNKTLSPQWEWNYQPREDKWSLTQKPSWLRLYAFKPLVKDNLLKAGNTLTQRSFRTVFNEVIIKMDISKMVDGQKAGLSHFGSPDYAAIGIACDSSKKTLEINKKGIFTKGTEIQSNIIWLKSVWSLDGISQFSYSLDGITFINVGDTYQLKWGAYRGDRIGIYNYNNTSEEGYVDIDFLHYTFK